MDGAKFEGGATDPIGKGGAVEIDALAAVDLGLPIERQMVGVLERRLRLPGSVLSDIQHRWIISCRSEQNMNNMSYA